MPNITYSLGGVSFDAVPRTGKRGIEAYTKSKVSIGRKRLCSLSVPGTKVSLAGDYLTEEKRASLEALIDQTETSGTKHVFDNGEEQHYAIIERFTCEAIVGITDAVYSFEMELLLLGEVPG
jgi:hypothetical protein